MTRLEKQKIKAIEDYWQVIDAPEGSTVAKNPLVQELVELCRASDSLAVISFNAQIWLGEDEMEDKIMLAEVDFYQKFVALAKKLAKQEEKNDD